MSFIERQKFRNHAQEGNKTDSNIWIFFFLFSIYRCGCCASRGSFPCLFPKQAHKRGRRVEEAGPHVRQTEERLAQRSPSQGPSRSFRRLLIPMHVSGEDKSHLTWMKWGQTLLMKTAVIWKIGTRHKEEIDPSYLTISSSWPLSAAWCKSALITIYNK